MIIHGTKIVEEKLGWVAEFCMICRLPRACQLFAIQSVRHLYFVPLGARTLICHEIECSECQTRIGTSMDRYERTVKKRPAEFTDLAAETMPELPEILGERLAVEKMIRENPSQVPPDIRKRLLLEPLQTLNAWFDKRYSSTEMDRPAGIGCFGTLALMVSVMVVWGTVKEPLASDICTVLMIMIAVGILYTLIQLGFVPRRALRNIVIPKLARSLKPLEPTAMEIENLLERCKNLGLRLGKAIKPAALLAALKTA